MNILRTSDERFDGLKDYAFQPHYQTIGAGLRIHYVDEGPPDAPPVLMLHGEPTWSYLYRHMIPRVAAAGLRVLAPDLIGFGRSDKPFARSDHSFAAQVGWIREWVETLNLKNITLVCQDWGSLIGLRLAAELEPRFARIILSNGGLPVGDGVFSPTFGLWRMFATYSPVLPISTILQVGTKRKLDAREKAAYEAPFPSAAFKAAPRVYPSLVPIRLSDPAREANLAAWKILDAWNKPFICCFSDGDPITGGLDKPIIERVPGARNQPHVTLRGGHFIQEDDPEGFSRVIVDALKSDAQQAREGCRDTSLSSIQADHDARAWSLPLDDIDVSDIELWRTDSFWPYFARLRREDPVHYCRHSPFGPYWSVTRFNDIMAVDTNHEVFSSEASLGGITILDQADDVSLPMFIAMDPPRHDAQRKTVSPIVAPTNLETMEPLIRERAGRILDELPVGETFDWVDRVSVELTGQMLATLFDFPFDQRRKLTYWSDVATTIPGPGLLVETVEQKTAVLMECLGAFTEIWNERVNAPPRVDLISMLAHGESTRNMTPQEYLGNLVLLIVGGNDTTRNSISGSIYALNKSPAEYDKLRANPALIPSMVSETIRWQTPLSHMRRTATRDIELGGKTIRKGDKVIMWYVSGNRDDTVIENPDAYVIDRPRARQHLSFGFGIHRCVGNRLAEMQLRVVWEEILKRFPRIEIVSEPERVPSPFIKGYLRLDVRIPKA